MMTSGSVMMTPAAIWEPKGVSNWDSPVNFDSSTVAGCMEGLTIIVTATRNSFQAPMKMMMAVVKMPGAASGRMTLRNAWPGVHPSTMADCSSSWGICRKKLVRFHTASGREKDRSGTIIAW